MVDSSTMDWVDQQAAEVMRLRSAVLAENFTPEQKFARLLAIEKRSLLLSRAEGILEANVESNEDLDNYADELRTVAGGFNHG